jgi:hypothetical protein
MDHASHRRAGGASGLATGRSCHRLHQAITDHHGSMSPHAPSVRPIASHAHLAAGRDRIANLEEVKVPAKGRSHSLDEPVM